MKVFVVLAQTPGSSKRLMIVFRYQEGAQEYVKKQKKILHNKNWNTQFFIEERWVNYKKTRPNPPHEN